MTNPDFFDSQTGIQTKTIHECCICGKKFIGKIIEDWIDESPTCDKCWEATA